MSRRSINKRKADAVPAARRGGNGANPGVSTANVPPGRSPILWGLLLALLVAGTFLSATRNDFINFDDNDYVTRNPHVQPGLTWEGVLWAFNAHEANWHPLTWWSHMLDCQMFGLDPRGHHLTSVLLHAVNAGLLFLVLFRMTGAMWRSWLVAALFGLHPLRVESVAWVSERKDVLSAFFFLLALWAYARYARRASNAKISPAYALCLLFFSLGLMSKPMVVTLPFVLLLLDYWPLERWKRTGWLGLAIEKIPFFILAGLDSAIAFIVQREEGTMGGFFSLPARAANALVACVRYLGKLFWPQNLAVFYPHPYHWPTATVFLAGLLVLGISICAVGLRRRFPCLLTGWFWFVGMLVPVIGLVQVGAQAMADRYTYLPSIGIYLILCWVPFELAKGRWHLVTALSVAATVAVLACMTLTYRQIGFWKDSEKLFRHTLAVTQDNDIAHNSLAAALIDQGRLEEAIGECQAALKLAPDFPDAHFNLGTIYDRMGRANEAIVQYQAGLKTRPHYAAAYNLGILMEKRGDFEEAIRQIENSIQINPDFPDAHNEFGILLASKGQLDDALLQFQRALQLKPDYSLARSNLETTLRLKAAH